MEKDNIIDYKNPTQNIVKDTLSEFLRESAQKMLQIAIEEVQSFILSYRDKKIENGNNRVVRNGYLPERSIQTGIGAVAVKVPRIRDRGEEDIKFTPSLIPQYMRRTATIDVLLPLLYLKGIPTNDFADSFEPILGSKPKNLSPNVISRLKAEWYEQYLKWRKRDLTNKKYVYFWADGVYLQARMESEKNCILTIIGADEYGKKEVIAIDDGIRESKESWNNLLLDLKSRGLSYAPKIAVGDGALGFWGALTEQYPTTTRQRCWVHKTINILNKLPKNMQHKAKEMLHNIYHADVKEKAEEELKKFITVYDAKYPKAAECLVKNKKALLAFYDFPAEHWMHLRTTNPIESTFATVKHRTRKSKNCFSRSTVVAATYKLFLEAQKRWLPLRGRNRIAQVINMEKFIDGVNQNEINNDNVIDQKYVA